MMDLNIRELSESFFEMLPHDKEKFTLSDIESSGIPFLVRKRIIQSAYEKFKESLKQPDSDWADLQSPKARDLWSSYLNQMKDELEIPASRAEDIIRKATEFALKLSVQPRKTIIKVLFENKDTVSKKELTDRMEEFVSNRHLVFALLRYMEKKKRETLDSDEAMKVIKKVDEKLVETYNSLDLMEAVKPIFNVAGHSVSTDLIRVFFEEKEMHRVARKFDLMEADITETEFVEIVSSADMLDLSGFEEEQPALFADEEERTHREYETAGQEESEQPPLNEENAKSSISESLAGSEIDNEPEETDDDADSEAESSIEEDDQDEPYLLQLFRDSDERNTDPNLDEPDQKADVEERFEEEIEEFDDETASPPHKEENDIFASGDDEITIAPEQSEEENLLEEEKEGEMDEVDTEASGEKEEEDVEIEEMPREEALISDEDESFEEWEDDDEIEEGSLMSRYMDEDEDPDTEDSEPEPETQEEEDARPATIYDELNLTPVDKDNGGDELDFEEDTDFDIDENPEESEIDDDLPFEPDKRFVSDHESDEDRDAETDEFEEKDAADDETDEVPMWKSFLERDNPDDEPSFYFDESPESSSDQETSLFDDLDEINETPIIEVTGDASVVDDEIEDLAKWLDADRDRFLHDIFNDSKLAWEQALIDLTVFDDWKSASRYLESEIFNKNRIDIYSEVAVDFTDYLHSYFMKHKT